MQTLTPSVRQDVTTLFDRAKNPEGGILTPELLKNAGNRAHAEAVSGALQDVEQIAGDEAKFRTQAILDFVQQEYEGAASRLSSDFESADADLRQDYRKNATVAASRRAAAHDPSATDFAGRATNMLQASDFMQQKEAQAVREGQLGAAREIDGLQEQYEDVTRLRHAGLSMDRDGRGVGLADWAQLHRQAQQLFGWLFLMQMVQR